MIHSGNALGGHYYAYIKYGLVFISIAKFDGYQQHDSCYVCFDVQSEIQLESAHP